MKQWIIPALMGLLSCGLDPSGAATAPGVVWRLREFDQARMNLNSVASFADVFDVKLVAVGDNGVGRLSNDGGRSWEKRSLSVYDDLREVMSFGSHWLAVGGRFGKAPVIVSSSDGEEWTSVWLGGISRLECLAPNPSQSEMIAMGKNGSMATSSNTENWLSSISGTRTTTGLVWTGGVQLLAIDLDGEIRSSSDGRTWTSRWRSPQVEFEALETSGVRHVVAGWSSTASSSLVLYSTDGENWTPASSPPSPAVRIRDMVWTGACFVAAADDGHVFTSPDGEVWSHHRISNIRDIHAMCWTGYHVVAVGQSGFIAKTGESIPDEAADWTIVDPGTFARSFTGMASAGVAGAQRLVIVGGLGNVMSSDDGGDHRIAQVSGISAYLKSIAATTIPTRTFLAVGSGGTVISSPDGVSWTSQVSGSMAPLECVTWSASPAAGSVAVVVGGDGTILSSGNGEDWSVRASGTSVWLGGVASGTVLLGKPTPLATRRIVAVGSGGAILTSPNGTTWTSQNSGTSRTLRAVAALDLGFVAVGDHGTILVSSNGTDWRSQSLDHTANLYAVTWTGSQLVTVGVGGMIHTSPDGIKWTARHTFINERLQTVLGLPSGRLCCAGVQDVFMTSDAIEGYDEWIAAQSVPSGEDGTMDDPNGDGIVNLLAYASLIEAMGTPDPELLALLPKMLGRTLDGRMRFQCLPPLCYDLDYIVEQSDDLQVGSWEEIFRYSMGEVTPADILGLSIRFSDRRVTLDLPEDPATHPRRFNRLRIKRIEP